MKKIILISILGLLTVNCSEKNNIDENNLESGSPGIVVKNAGLVLLNSYNVMLFQRLHLLENNQFVSESEYVKAVSYLQYLATGISQEDESLLSLNKILCGIGVQDSIGNSVEISDQDKVVIDNLIESAINYWPAIGVSTISEFQGNWLMRNGILMETEDRWELSIEKKVYDVLLNTSPFSFSIIKLPWMPKPLHVKWTE